MATDLEKPLLSAIMIVFNGEKFIEKAIDSVLNQSYKNFELLILNDGSTDTTELIISAKSLSDNRIKYIKNDKNSGLSYSRNKIIHNSKGDFIVVVDSDDINDPDRFKNQIDYLLKHTNIDVFGASVTLINEKGRTFGTWNYPATDTAIKQELLNSCAVANPSSIFRKEVFHKIGGYNENLTICEDWDFFVRAARHFNFSNDDRSNILYRIHDNNISRTKLDRTIIYSLYLKLGLNESCLNLSISDFIDLYPHLKSDISTKAIQFYGFWIQTYYRLGYTNTAREVSEDLKSKFYIHFSKQEKKIYEKNNIKTYLKTKNLGRLIPSILNYITL